MRLFFPFRLISKSNEKFRNKQGHVFTSKRFKDFEKDVKALTIAQKPGLFFDGDVSLSIDACFRSKVHCDATNLFKSVNDALQGILYKNDKQIKFASITIATECADQDSFTVTIREFIN